MGDGFSTLCSTLPISAMVAAVGEAAVAVAAAAQAEAANLDVDVVVAGAAVAVAVVATAALACLDEDGVDVREEDPETKVGATDR